MKHDFRTSPEGDAAEQFLVWLETETIDGLRKSHGDGEATKAQIYLFTNRAYEAHMTPVQIDDLFCRSIVRAGYSEAEEGAILAWLDFFAQLASKVHG